MPSFRLLASATVLALAAGAAFAQPAHDKPADAPPRQPRVAKPDVKAPEVAIPEDMKSKGTPYYCLSGMERNASFHSDAPKEKIDGYTTLVAGYAIAGPKDAPAKLVGAEWHMPVASLDTGNPMKNQHLAGDGWMDATKNPDCVFKLKEVKDITPSKDAAKPGVTAYDCTLVGDWSMHGQTKPLIITGAKVSFMPESEASAKVAKGDLMKIDSKFHLKLSDYGVENKVVGQKVADDLDITTTLVHSTVKPESKPAK